ncbi:hypothetical protein [Sphingomonas sp. UYP23]
MRTVTAPTGVTFLVDEEGGRWPSVRDCFWGKRLGMSRSMPSVQDEQLELMLTALASLDRSVVAMRESIHETFKGALFYRFYFHWLHAAGLIEGGHSASPMASMPNDEGVAVIRMLIATRPLGLNGVPIGSAAVKAFGEPGSAAECNRERFAAAEGKARRLAFAFVREQLFGKAAISLLYRDLDTDMPLVRTIWHQPFADDRSRDRTFEWMYERLDRWTAWGELGLRNGATALTQHLFSLLVLDEKRISDPDPVPPVRLAIVHKG